VPTFNGGRLLERCLDATLDAAEVDEVIVLDGGSTDGSPERAERRDRIRVLRRPDLCVMARINVGVAEARNGLVLILNDDAFVDRDTPRRLAEVLVEQPITALVGAHLRSEDGRPQRSASHFRTLLAETLSALGLGRALRGILIRAPIRARADG